MAGVWDEIMWNAMWVIQPLWKPFCWWRSTEHPDTMLWRGRDGGCWPKKHPTANPSLYCLDGFWVTDHFPSRQIQSVIVCEGKLNMQGTHIGSRSCQCSCSSWGQESPGRKPTHPSHPEEERRGNMFSCYIHPTVIINNLETRHINKVAYALA